MKKILIPLVLLLAVNAWADFKEGTHYRRLPVDVPTQVAEGKVEVRELFWYGCPHCYSFEPYLEKWIKNKPAEAEFIRMPAVMNPGWVNHARLYYTIEALDLEQKLHPLIFTGIHEQRRRLINDHSLLRFIRSQGMKLDTESFRNMYGSSEISMKLEQARQLQSKYKAGEVPVVVVNGKYLVTGSLAGGYAKMLEIINYLTARESAK